MPIDRLKTWYFILDYNFWLSWWIFKLLVPWESRITTLHTTYRINNFAPTVSPCYLIKHTLGVIIDRFICFYLPVSLLAIRLPCFNKLELNWVELSVYSAEAPRPRTGVGVSPSCLFTSKHSPVTIYTVWWQRHKGVNNLPRVGNRTHNHLI